MLIYGLQCFIIEEVKRTKVGDLRAFDIEKRTIVRLNTRAPFGYNIQQVANRPRSTSRLGTKFRKHLKDNGIKLSHVSRKLELSNGYVSNLLSGTHGYVITTAVRTKLNEILQTNY